LDQPKAIDHFKTVCLAADESEAALLAEWAAGKLPSFQLTLDIAHADSPYQ